jgi:hypothetical protein
MAARTVEASSAVLVRLDVGHELDEFVGFPVQVEEVQRKSGRGSQELLRRARRWIILDLILILSSAAKTLSWSNGQRRGYNYRLAAPAIIQNVNKPAIIRT